MRKIVIAGGSGFLGNVLRDHFKRLGDEVVILTRGQTSEYEGAKHIHWDGEKVDSWAEALEGADALINLSGRTVNCRYNEKNKREIYESRLKSTRALGEAVKTLKNPPKVWLNSSSATIYENSFDEANDEFTGKIGTGFSVDVCLKWEEEFSKIVVPGVRKVYMRTAMVIGKGGPFLNLM
ncbi:MAG: NAD-dependent epimerase/dehydratase family protein, partial [Lentisphaeraceae bacterium]|nr:NAD-dependent epimerase/dehydratase family protein [Lentisphaeraceae bacterium]